MPKEGEINYLKNIGSDGVWHAAHKPYSDPECGRMLIDIGCLMSALPHPPARLLDLGCGTGWTSIFFAERGYQVVGVDIAPDMIDLAEKNRLARAFSNVQFQVGDYETLQFSNEFDCAVFYDALHHAEDEQAAINAAYRALKLGGVLLVLEPGEGHAQAEHSMRAVERYGVTERDMPAQLIIAAAKKIGFRSWRTLPDYASLNRIVRGEINRKWIKFFLRFRLGRALSMAGYLFLYNKMRSLVILSK